jgi:hypothetical protein
MTAKKQSRKGRKMEFKTYFPMLGTDQGICLQGLEAGSFPLRRRVFASSRSKKGFSDPARQDKLSIWTFNFRQNYFSGRMIRILRGNKNYSAYLAPVWFRL